MMRHWAREIMRDNTFIAEEQGGAPLWCFPENDPYWVDKIVEAFGVHRVTAEVLAARHFHDLKEIHHFLYAKLPDLHDPKLFLDMALAVQRVARALERGEGILIYGDNDVDGITGTALLAE